MVVTVTSQIRFPLSGGSDTAPYAHTLRRNFQVIQILHHMRVRQEEVSESSGYCTICVCDGTEPILHRTDTALMRVR